MNTTIANVTAREILDSRGNPTLSATVTLADGTVGTASVPSGASTGEHEAHELRDGDPSRYGGKGVLHAVRNVNTTLASALKARNACDQNEIDRLMCSIDATPEKSNLGANAILAVSLANAAAAAASCHLPLYRYLGGVGAREMPIPMMNILNGGAHAGNGLDVQEFMVLPVGLETMRERVRCGAEISHTLGRLLKERGHATGVGDEGGFAPDLRDEIEALDLIVEAIRTAGYDTDRVKLALDVAASEWMTPDGYRLPKRGITRSTEEMIDWIEYLCHAYPIVSVEDGLAEDDWAGWQALTARLGSSVMLVGDDLFVTNVARLGEGIKRGAANAVLVKPNQIGTLSETLAVMQAARSHCYQTIVSHRSGETGDTFLADLAVASGSPYIKTGAPCRGERTEKYNRLMAIEEELAAGKE